MMDSQQTPLDMLNQQCIITVLQEGEKIGIDAGV
jgi:hypothetical protein